MEKLFAIFRKLKHQFELYYENAIFRGSGNFWCRIWLQYAISIIFDYTTVVKIAH